jgi:hypothetical protein
MTVVVVRARKGKLITPDWWDAYCKVLQERISYYSNKIYFSGENKAHYRRKSVWIFECSEEKIHYLRRSLAEVRRAFQQDPLKWLICVDEEIL